MSSTFTTRRHALLKWAALAAITAAALYLRYLPRGYVSGDMRLDLLKWYNYVLDHGRWLALRDEFANYTPPYLYLMVLATYLQGLMSSTTAVKLIALPFDFVAAFFAYRIVRLKFPVGLIPTIAYAAVLFTPTVFINGAVWGQLDVIYTACLLACVYFCLVQKPFPAMLSFALALDVKIQAIFLAPFVLMLLFRQRLRWAHLLLIPAVYLVMALPAALFGRPLWNLLLIYPKQVNLDAELWMGASTLYYYIPNAYFRIGVLVGTAVALLATAGYVWAGVRSKAPLSRELLLVAATTSAALLPELLPKMHDRYFLPADVLSIVLAFYIPRLWFLAPLFQVVSLTGYSWFLLNRPIIPMPLAVAAGLIATGTLVVVYVRSFRQSVAA